MPLSRRPLLIHERGLVALCDAIKQRIISEFPAFRMRFGTSDANLNMAPLLSDCAANRAFKLQRRVSFVHLGFLLRIHQTGMVNIEHPLFRR